MAQSETVDPATVASNVDNADLQQQQQLADETNETSESIKDFVHFADSTTTTSSSSSSSSSDDSYPSPPDGGWGWVIVIASFTAHMIADGCAASVGVLYSDLLDGVDGSGIEGSGSKAETAWVASLFVSMPALCGPIASILTNHFGCRRTTIAGGIIAAIGCFLASFANNIATICIFFGVIGGFGLSLVYIPAVVIVAYYFKKRRSLATGIAVAGSGIGTFIFAPVTQVLIDEFAWHGALKITSALILNIVVCGYLFRPLVSPKLERRRRRYLRSLERFSRVSSRRASGDGLDRHSMATCNHEEDGAIPVCVLCKDTVEPLSHSLIQFPTYLQNGNLPEECIFSTDILSRGSQSLINLTSSSAAYKKAVIAELKMTKIDHCCVEVTAESAQNTDDDDLDAIKKESKRSKKEKVKQDKQQNKQAHYASQFVPRYRTDVIYRGSLLKTGFLLRHGQSASCPDILVHAEKKKSDHSSLLKRLHKLVPGVLLHVRNALDFSIFRSPIFILFCTHCMLYNMSYDIPYIYIADYASESGIDGHSFLGESFLISIIGIVSTFGQVVVGFVGDRPSVNRVQFYMAMTFLAGLAVLCIPLIDTYELLATCCGVFGFFVSANFTLVTIILVELLGMDQLTNAYGFVSMAEGISTLLGPPLAGWLTDETGSYYAAFYAAGCVICASALSLFLVPCLRPCDKIVSLKSESVQDDKEVEDDDDDADVETVDGVSHNKVALPNAAAAEEVVETKTQPADDVV